MSFFLPFPPAFGGKGWGIGGRLFPQEVFAPHRSGKGVGGVAVLPAEADGLESPVFVTQATRPLLRMAMRYNRTRMESSPAHPEQTIRAFIAIPLPTTFRQDLAELRQQLERLAPDGVRWVAPQNIHLTLKFLGDTPRAQLSAVEGALSRVVEGEALFSLHSQGLGAFPSWRSPRVIWAGLEDHPALMRLQQEVELALAELGFRVEERPFTAHLTLGRVSRPLPQVQRERLASFAQDLASGSLGSVPVDQVCLFQSQLRPTGPVYTCLFSAQLVGTNSAAGQSGY